MHNCTWTHTTESSWLLYHLYRCNLCFLYCKATSRLWPSITLVNREPLLHPQLTVSFSSLIPHIHTHKHTLWCSPIHGRCNTHHKGLPELSLTLQLYWNRILVVVLKVSFRKEKSWVHTQKHCSLKKTKSVYFNLTALWCCRYVRGFSVMMKEWIREKRTVKLELV